MCLVTSKQQGTGVLTDVRVRALPTRQYLLMRVVAELADAPDSKLPAQSLFTYYKTAMFLDTSIISTVTRKAWVRFLDVPLTGHWCSGSTYNY